MKVQICSLLAAEVLCLLYYASSSLAFSPPLQTTNQWSNRRRLSFNPLRAGGEAPQYDKIDGILEEAEKLGAGTYMLHVKTPDDSDVQLDYQPGHVLALEIEDTSNNLNEDAKNNGGWMRGPYTVSRCTETSLDVMIRVVGKKSKAFAESSVGTPVRFGGKFKVPILEGINNNSDKAEGESSLKQIVLISTGVGIGPCVGAIELALSSSSSSSSEEKDSFPPIALFASFREESDVAYGEYLDQLASQHGAKFEWHPIITSEVGRLSSCDDNMKLVSKTIAGLSIDETHYHLIGNGQMVNEWKEGLEKAGVPTDRVTIEQYFNHKAEVDPTAIQTIASVIRTAAAAAVEVV